VESKINREDLLLNRQEEKIYVKIKK